MSHINSILLVGAIVLTGRILFMGLRDFTKENAGKRASDRFAIFAVATMINVIVFWWVAVGAGGDAMGGKIVGDEYFLGDHGRYTSVSFGFWLYSLVHGIVTVASFILMFVGQFVRIITGSKETASEKAKSHTRGRGTV